MYGQPGADFWGAAEGWGWTYMPFESMRNGYCLKCFFCDFSVGDYIYNAFKIGNMMKQPQDRQIRSTIAMPKSKDSDRKSELQAINRILDRRYEVLVELG